MKFKLLYALILSIITLITSSVAIADINMGVFPRRPVAKTYKFFKPLAVKLSKELGEPVNLIVAKNFRSFWKDLQNGKYDIVHYNQYHYLLNHKSKGYKVIAVNEEFGSSQIAGSLTVRKDSGINSIKDLKGRTILFGGGKKAMGSYIAPTALLKKAGLIAGTDYKVKFSKNPPGAIIAVYNKVADAAGAGNVILRVKGVTTKIDVKKMKILAESEKFIHLAWAVKGDMPQSKIDKIQQIMTTLKSTDPSVLKSAKVTNFIKANDADFAKVREIVKFVTGEDL